MPQNEISTISQPKHKSKVPWFVYNLVLMAVISGFLFGYNTTIVSPAMLYVKENNGMIPLDNSWQELIVAVTPGVQGFGALLASFPAKKFGRKPVIIFSSVVFTIGAIICGIAFAKWILLIGRILLGLAIGLSSMSVCIYVSESSPAHLRGVLLTSFHALLTFGQFFANVVGGAFSYVDPVNVGWRLMFAVAAVPSVIQFVGFLFLPESPRNLYERGRKKECEQVLAKIYNNDAEWVKYEMEEIRRFYAEHEKAKELKKDNFTLLKILKTPHVFKALLLGCSLQAFQQLSGVNTLMYYTGNIIKSTGVKDNHSSIWISVGVTVVLFCGNLVPLFIVERFGRRKILLTSVFGCCISIILMGGGFLAINKDSAISLSSPNSSLFDTTVKNYHKCIRHSNCDLCVTDENCGFCAPVDQKHGFCLPKPEHNSAIRSTTGYCSTQSSDNYHNINSTKYEWADVYCYTKFTIWPICVMVVYLWFMGYGFSPMAWVLNSEFYPLWARGTCMGISTFMNGICNSLIALTFLNLSEAITKYGAFFLYAVITIIALIIFTLFIPETKGLGLDEIEMLFMSKKEREKSKLFNDSDESSSISSKY